MTVVNKTKWKKLPLSDCLSFISRGVAPKYVPKSHIAALNQRALRWGHIEKKFLKYHDPLKKVKEEVFIRKGDIAVNSTGDITIGRAFYFNRDWPNLFADSHVTIIRLNKDILLPEFCIYLFPTKEYQSKIYGLVTGTTGQLELSKSNLSKLEFDIPSIYIQSKIAAVLSTYDDLIENNTRRIRILEEMAQALYREWFVNFRFPGCESVRMVESELGLVPEGWVIRKLGEICFLTMGQSPNSEFYNENGDGLPFHQGVTNFGSRFPIDKIFCTITNRVAESGDILFSVRAPVGRINLADKKIIVGRGLSAIRNKNGNQLFTYHQLKEIFQEEDMIGGGTIFKSVTKEDVNYIKLLTPDSSFIKLFEENVEPISLQLDNLIIRNMNLHRTRDLLLPKLISGEIDVSELDIRIPEAET